MTIYLCLLCNGIYSQNNINDKISLDSFIIYNKSKDITKQVKIHNTAVLAYDENSILVKFSNHSPDRNFIFKVYELDKSYKVNIPEDKGWISCANQIFYPNLEGGEYKLVIKSITANIEPLIIHLSIERPYWLKWWFTPMMFFYALIIAGIIIYLIFLYRFRQQTKLQRVRNDIASDLHDDVGATLSSISFFGEMMRSKILKNAPAEEVLALLEKVINTSKETIETMRGVVWTINPNNDNAVDFLQKLHSFGKEMLSAKNINFNFQTQGFEKVKLPLDIQRNLFLFFKESINNIAKHSKATNVTGEISPISNKREAHGVKLFIYDNGIGFNTSDLYEGHGLKSLRKRADELQGNLEIQSVIEQGTTITLSFPLP